MNGNDVAAGPLLDRHAHAGLPVGTDHIPHFLIGIADFGNITQVDALVLPGGNPQIPDFLQAGEFPPQPDIVFAAVLADMAAGRFQIGIGHRRQDIGNTQAVGPQPLLAGQDMNLPFLPSDQIDGSHLRHRGQPVLDALIGDKKHLP
ncbi:MAG: hypothetical protein BWY71_02315 [Planctomycetes bacterium ADurb.Bin412]|nr:MAG: hypothetical protein BWY71_02315 [Planctomycetes bacterium ADurb.Bin412]